MTEVDLTLSGLRVLAMAVVASSLLVAGASKLLDIRGAAIEILDYRLLPPVLAMPAAIALAAANVLVGLALFADAGFARPFAIALLTTYTLAVIAALLRGLPIDCHCGPGTEALRWWTVGRNLLLIACSLAGSAALDETVVGIEAGMIGSLALSSLALRYVFPRVWIRREARS